ncbi:MAG: hypothetical protein WCL23_01770 [Candidatus Moraniibacteriota bacterium]
MKRILFIGGDTWIHAYWVKNLDRSYSLNFSVTQEDGSKLLESQTDWSLIAVSSFVQTSKEAPLHYPYRVLNTLGIIKKIRGKYPHIPIFGIGAVEEIGKRMIEEAGCHCYIRGLDAPERIKTYLETPVANAACFQVAG